MMKRLLLSSLVILAISTSACVPPQGSSPRTAPPAPNEMGGDSDSPVPRLNLDGTVSGGGGNGLDGKVAETYSIKLDTLPEYRKYIVPILQRMSRNEPDVLIAYLNWSITHKGWYLVPMELPELPKEQVALAFGSDQLAIHSERSVYIRADKYNGSSMKDKATLLMHEMVMAARLLMKQPPKLQCEALSTLDNRDCESEEMLKLAKSKGLDEKAMKMLDASDHEAVRLMTVHLMTKDQDVSGESIGRFRKKLGFDFPWDQIVSNISMENLLQAAQRSELSGDFLSLRSGPASHMELANRKPGGAICLLNMAFYSPQYTYVQIKIGHTWTQKPKDTWSEPVNINGENLHFSIIDSYYTSMNDETLETQGVLDPRDGKTVVDRVRIKPSMLNRFYGSDSSGNRTERLDGIVIDAYLTREEGPRIVLLEVRKVRPLFKKGATAYGAVDDSVELIPIKEEPIRCAIGPAPENTSVQKPSRQGMDAGSAAEAEPYIAPDP